MPTPPHGPAAALGYRRRTDPDLAEGFRKDADREDFLEGLNADLAPREEAGYADLEERWPTLHVVGAPRTGTTLLSQVVAAGLEVGYVNNLVAAFWLAPVTGLRLAGALGLERPDTSFTSRFGRTRGVEEPHEFGYFWNHHLRYPDLRQRDPGHEDTIDWARLRRVIVNMAEARGAPMAFKPMLLAWHMEAMRRHMPRTCYLWIRRDPLDAALSILRMRRALRGSEEAWTSLRPREDLSGEPPWRQVAAQVVLVERAIGEAAARMGSGHVLEVAYERLCARPAAVLEDVREMMASKGHAPARGDVELPAFEARRDPSRDDDVGRRVAEALDHYRRAFPLRS